MKTSIQISALLIVLAGATKGQTAKTIIRKLQCDTIHLQTKLHCDTIYSEDIKTGLMMPKINCVTDTVRLNPFEVEFNYNEQTLKKDLEINSFKLFIYDFDENDLNTFRNTLVSYNMNFLFALEPGKGRKVCLFTFKNAAENKMGIIYKLLQDNDITKITFDGKILDIEVFFSKYM